MLDFLNKLRRSLSPRDKWLALLMIAMMAVGAFLELVGLGLVLPVISAFSNPELLQQNRYLSWMYHILAPSSLHSFMLISAGALILFYLLKNVYTAFMIYCQGRYAIHLNIQLSDRLFRNYLYAPYKFHLMRNSMTLMNNITRMQQIVSAVIMPLMLILSECFVIAAILLAILVMSPGITILAVGVIGTLMLVLYLPLKRFLERNGADFQKAQDLLSRDLHQSLNSIREIKLRSSESYFAEQHLQAQKMLNLAMMRQSVFGNIPRLMLETFAVLLAICVLVSLSFSHMQTANIMIAATLFAVAMFRLLPCMSRIQYNMLILRGNSYLFELIYHELHDVPQEVLPAAGKKDGPLFRNELKVDHLSFSYDPGKLPDILHDFSMTLKPLESLALIGVTGSGKTTLVDLLMGFLKPRQGTITLDGTDIQSMLPLWRSRIGYVPQTIFLSDDTLRCNIAMGVPPEQIDDKRIREVLRIAQLDKFVESLPEQLQTRVGESGTRLSGGQRQRVVIARALYFNPEILILDEATSALDQETERAFIDAIEQLHGKLTILMIAHRLSTIAGCDRTITLTPLQHS